MQCMQKNVLNNYECFKMKLFCLFKSSFPVRHTNSKRTFLFCNPCIEMPFLQINKLSCIYLKVVFLNFIIDLNDLRCNINKNVHNINTFWGYNSSYDVYSITIRIYSKIVKIIWPYFFNGTFMIIYKKSVLNFTKLIKHVFQIIRKIKKNNK